MSFAVGLVRFTKKKFCQFATQHGG
jgi:hypothetical protein